MATEETEISELEFREDLSGDDLLPVETTKDTFATSLTKVKDWVDEKIDPVHKTGDEEISGIKTINTGKPLYCGFTYKGTSPLKATESVISRPVLMVTSENEFLGAVQWQQNTEFNVGSLFCASKEGTLTSLRVGFNSSGTEYTYAPASAALNSIVTTTGISKSSNGYVKLGNGIIIQWGGIDIKASGSDITFLTPFTTEVPQIFFGAFSSVASTYAVGGIYSKRSKTGFTAHGWNVSGTQDRYCSWLAIGY